MGMTVRDLRRMLDGLDPGARIRVRTDATGNSAGDEGRGQSFRIIDVVPWERASGSGYVVIHTQERDHG